MSDEIDEFSDLDLIVVTTTKISDSKSKMLTLAKQLGDFLSGFTGEHVGEPRVLICLYDNPLLHVDIKFLTLDELTDRIENPHLLFDRSGKVNALFQDTEVKYPSPDYQWIEDRFWTWIHYTLTKIGRGEYLEAFDFFGFLRMVVLGPLLQVKNGNPPRAVRRAETGLSAEDLSALKGTIPGYDSASLLISLRNSVQLYRDLRIQLFGEQIILHEQTEAKVMEYFDHIEQMKQ